MSRSTWALVALAACCPPEPAKQTAVATVQQPAAKPEIRDLAVDGEVHLKNLHQLTFGADNAEAYWSFAGDRLIMQTNHAPYKCDQIEEIAMTGGPGKLVSTGKGRTTCSYFLKGDKEIIYASTHEASAECPTPPDMSKGYYWGLFEYDIYRANADGSNLRKLTNTKGYDAEATVCPVDGSIIFTSMRSGDLELWRMDADGKNLKQLTDLPGYDGGAFFSADCSKIVWRASRPQPGPELDEYKELLAKNLVKPTKMDIWVANADGSDARQVTYLAGASFAPFFFPSGRRIIFASNYLQPRGPEFDLFAIDIDGSHLERITYAQGFDGFPMFSPDGKHLAFSSNRRNDVIKDPTGKDVYRMTGGTAGEHDTNVFVADWVDVPPDAAKVSATPADRFIANVAYLADDAREGRGVGTKGLTDSLQFVEDRLKEAGVQPGIEGKWRQPFDVVSSLDRDPATAVAIDTTALPADAFAPLSFSKSAKVSAPIVAVGSGIVDGDAKIDDYKGKDVKGKIVMLHMVLPTPPAPAGEAADAKVKREELERIVGMKWGGLRRRVFVARQKGAVGVIAVDDADPKRDEVPLPALEPSHGDAGIAVVAIKRKAGEGLDKGAHKATLQIALKPVHTTTDNILGVIRGGAAAKQPGVIVVGAHIDHLGMGGVYALDSKHDVHNGADDNASGVAALIEVARTLNEKRAELSRDVYIVGFSAEEMGVLGSEYMVKHPVVKEAVVAMINMDMVGRMRANHLTVNGGDSAKEWRELVAPACKAARVECTIGGSGYGPSDHMPFYRSGVPVIFLFTGNHRDYHTVNDDTDKINAVGGARVAMIAADTAIATANHKGPLTYVKAPPEVPKCEEPDPKDPKKMIECRDDRPRSASLGTIPSYDEDPSRPPGLVISDVVPNGPAAKAGLKGGDRIVDVGGTKIDNINDLMFVLQAVKPGQNTTITYVRDGKRITVDAVFGVPRRR